MFFVMGYNDTDIIFLSKRAFVTFTEAEHYLNSVSQGWKPFIVEKVVPK